MSYDELMAVFSRPRPNGSQGERETRQAIKDWLERHGIPLRVHTFHHYPYFFECIGVWLIFSRTMLALAAWQRWGWYTLLIALVASLGATVDIFLHIPLVTWPGRRTGENILIEFNVPDPQREVLVCAHYDSKTEPLDHHKRMFFLRRLPLGMALTLLVGILGPLDAWLLAEGSFLAGLTYWAGILASLPMLFLAWGLGLNCSIGRLLKPSQGAVDNGTACAILLGLARQLHSHRSVKINASGPSEHTCLTLALFTGEEVNLQGSRAYASQREWLFPAIVLNMEAMAQDGPYVFWEQDGSLIQRLPTSTMVNEAISQAVKTVTGELPCPGGPMLSDCGSFLAAGIPGGVLGTYDSKLADTGFHSSKDHLGRVAARRLEEGVDILCQFLKQVEQGMVAFERSEPGQE